MSDREHFHLGLIHHLSLLGNIPRDFLHGLLSQFQSLLMVSELVHDTTEVEVRLGSVLSWVVGWGWLDL